MQDATHEYRVVRPDGSVRWVESRLKMMPGEEANRFGILMDVTERKSREQLILRSQRLDAAGRMLRGLAHDFNNFLALISATLDPIHNMDLDPRTADRLESARQAAMAGALFSRRLVNIAQDREWRPQYMSLRDHLAQLPTMMMPLMKRDITIAVECFCDPWPVHVDPVECDSALINLLLNARDAMPSGGGIKVQLSNVQFNSTPASGSEQTGEFVKITVSDTGLGMDAATLARASEPFFTTKPDGAGTGLGLSSVAAFVGAAGGFLSMESEQGLGTSVSLHLPRAVELPVTRAWVSDRALWGNGELVLVVDDEPAMREITMQRLEALGYAVEGSPDAGTAIKLLEETCFALVLSDINMPGHMNGLELRDWLGREMPDLPVLLITAHDYLVSISRSILSKRCGQDELAHAVAAALASAPHHARGAAGLRVTEAART